MNPHQLVVECIESLGGLCGALAGIGDRSRLPHQVCLVRGVTRDQGLVVRKLCSTHGFLKRLGILGSLGLDLGQLLGQRLDHASAFQRLHATSGVVRTTRHDHRDHDGRDDVERRLVAAEEQLAGDPCSD